MFEQSVSQFLPRLRAKTKLCEEPRLARAEAMRGVQQIACDLFAVNDRLFSMGEFHSGDLLCENRIPGHASIQIRSRISASKNHAVDRSKAQHRKPLTMHARRALSSKIDGRSARVSEGGATSLLRAIPRQSYCRERRNGQLIEIMDYWHAARREQPL